MVDTIFISNDPLSNTLQSLRTFSASLCRDGRAVFFFVPNDFLRKIFFKEMNVHFFVSNAFHVT